MAEDCRSNTQEYTGVAANVVGAAAAGAKKKKKVHGSYLKPKKDAYKDLDAAGDWGQKKK